MQISKKQFKTYLDSWEFTLIDVRTQQEQEMYWVISENQLHIDISQPTAIEKLLKLPKTDKYLIYCWHWVRSLQVNQFMRVNWYEKVYDLEGGIDEWNKN